MIVSCNADVPFWIRELRRLLGTCPRTGCLCEGELLGDLMVLLLKEGEKRLGISIGGGDDE